MFICDSYYIPEQRIPVVRMQCTRMQISTYAPSLSMSILVKDSQCGHFWRGKCIFFCNVTLPNYLFSLKGIPVDIYIFFYGAASANLKRNNIKITFCPYQASLRYGMIETFKD